MKYNRSSLFDNIFVKIYGKEIYSGNLLQKITVKKTEKAKAKPLDNYRYSKIYQNKKIVLLELLQGTKKSLA